MLLVCWSVCPLSSLNWLACWKVVRLHLIVLHQGAGVVFLGLLELPWSEGSVTQLLDLLAFQSPSLLLHLLVVDDSPVGDCLAACSELWPLTPQLILSSLLLYKLIYLLTGHIWLKTNISKYGQYVNIHTRFLSFCKSSLNFYVYDRKYCRTWAIQYTWSLSSDSNPSSNLVTLSTLSKYSLRS